ncbi:RPM1-interacting protein 4-like isoform X1 [Camellia sinensis]|uniref:RPM1-interacting protein 4-like isoform X1 n=1 Tax=Camellia sinensis TaxID=4442 RepID=UPI001036A680|nr:RPM1-interacting protein 4-like isoform X1 [Camellia sinensis]
MAQQRSHVPKFGNWESDNIPYTAYFENARKERASGVMMNPNDPEENPEAFMFGGRMGTGSDGVSNKSMSLEKQHTEGLHQHKGHRRNTSDQQKSGSHRSVTSESGSEKSSNSDYSLLQQKHRHTRSTTRKKSTTEVNNLGLASPGHDRLRSASNQLNDMSYGSAASVPKFGAWDERDPKSGEGFTVIFDKVKQEKHIAAAKVPTMPPPPSNYMNSQKKNTRSKVCIHVFEFHLIMIYKHYDYIA